VSDRGRAAIADCLQLLARAVRQFHTYPPTSRMCTEAIDVCHRAFLALKLEHPLAIRVMPSELMLDDDDTGFGRGTIIEQELSRPLFRARVAALEIGCAVSQRDWSQFCAIVAALGPRSQPNGGVAERLLDAGVSAIVPRVTPRPEVLDLGTPAGAVQDLVARERTRQAAAMSNGPAQHLYPPDKGWVRLDPAVAYESISLADLTVMVNDPAELAGMLARLVDEDAGDRSGDGDALTERYGDIVKLIGALDPRLGQVLFSKLARAVLELESDRRRSLLRSAILPGLLDGRLDGEAVLTGFPDTELADALCLLPDLEAASPELLPVALDRLKLPPERRNAVVPLIAAGLNTRSAASGPDDKWARAGFDRRGAELTRVDATSAKSFTEFSAYDLSLNPQAMTALEGIRTAVATADATALQLSCAAGLAAVEPNPAVVFAIVGRTVPTLQALARNGGWADLTAALARFDRIASELESPRADVAQAIRETIGAACDRDFIVALAALASGPDRAAQAAAVVTALGPAIVPAWLRALDAPADRGKARALTPLLTECAVRLAPAIAERLPELGTDAACAALAVLGAAGSGYETVVAEHVVPADERRSREALRALARIGTTKASSLIAGHIERGTPAIQPAAEEALWRLPAAVAAARARDLLGRREFVIRHPQAATHLLERVGSAARDSFNPILESLKPLRFRFWNPALARVGAKARELLQ
jgi:hypothetical protein